LADSSDAGNGDNDPDLAEVWWHMPNLLVSSAWATWAAWPISTVFRTPAELEWIELEIRGMDDDVHGSSREPLRPLPV